MLRVRELVPFTSSCLCSTTYLGKRGLDYVEPRLKRLLKANAAAHCPRCPIVVDTATSALL